MTSSDTPHGITDWVRCPECHRRTVRLSIGNGRLRLSCEHDDCLATTSKLVGKHTFGGGRR